MSVIYNYLQRDTLCSFCRDVVEQPDFQTRLVYGFGTPVHRDIKTVLVKREGMGVCVYHRWCKTVVVQEQLCV